MSPDGPDNGAISTEYALLAAFIAAVVAGAVFALHNVVGQLFSMGFAAFS